jgi:restriction endonuclease S subunit
MKYKFETKTIGDCCDIIKKSIHPEKGQVYTCFSLPAFDNSNTPEILNGEEIKSSKFVLDENTILFNKLNPKFRRVWNIHSLEKYENTICSTEFLPLKAKANIEQDYLYYYVSSPYFTRLMDGIRTGTSNSQQRIDWKQFLREPINVPSLPIQRKVVSLLRNIDKKIELNNAINNNLEQQAQAIFKSWFIDFEPFGGVQPPEMKFVPLQELCKVVTKGTTPTTLGKPFTSSGINFIKAESILDSHSIDSSKFAFIDEETNALLKRSVIKANDIVFTIAGTLGRFAMVDNSVLPANTNQAVAIIRPDEKKVTPAYLYSFFIGNWHNEYYSKRIQQAVQANLNLTTIKSLPIAVLSNTTMNNYDELVSPLFALMKGNEEENRRLSELRDTLLPKLMSSELDVSNIEF